MKCDALWVTQPNHLEIRPLEVRDEPLADEVQIAVKACGLCAWDSYLFQGISSPVPPPYVFGHEAVGVITKVGAQVTKFKVGDKVAVCNSGKESKQMAKVVNNAAAGVTKLPDDTTDFARSVYEPANCVVNLLYKLQIAPGDHVVLVGAGYMGLLTLQGLMRGSAAGRVTVFEKRPERREMAKALAPECVLDPDSEEGKAKIKEIYAEGGADVVIEFSASESGFAVANQVIGHRGAKFAIGSWHRHNMTFDGTTWHMSGITVYNLSPMSNKHYLDISDRTSLLIAKGVYDPASLVTHIVQYKDPNLEEIFRKSITKEDGYIKAVISFED